MLCHCLFGFEMMRVNVFSLEMQNMFNVRLCLFDIVFGFYKLFVPILGLCIMYYFVE